MLPGFHVEIALFCLATTLIWLSIVRIALRWSKLGQLTIAAHALIRSTLFLTARSLDPSGVYWMGWRWATLFSNQTTISVCVLVAGCGQFV